MRRGARGAQQTPWMQVRILSGPSTGNDPVRNKPMTTEGYSMITVLAFDELQKAAPETTITSLNTPFDGFCSIGIEPPKYIRDYFREFLSKAIEFTAGNECRIELMRPGLHDA